MWIFTFGMLRVNLLYIFLHENSNAELDKLIQLDFFKNSEILWKTVLKQLNEWF